MHAWVFVFFLNAYLLLIPYTAKTNQTQADAETNTEISESSYASEN